MMKTIQKAGIEGTFSSVHSVVSNSLQPHNHSTPGLPVHHQIPEFTQTHVYWVSDAIQPSHPPQHNKSYIWQFSSVAQLCPTLRPGTAAHQASLSFTISWSLLKLMSIESVMPSSHLILCRPILLLPLVPPSIRVFPMSQLFQSGGQSIAVSASASVLPMNTQDWSPLWWTSWTSLQSMRLSIKSLLQHHSSKAPIFLCSVFSIVQLSHLYMTSGKPYPD